MSKTETIRARVEPGLKRDAEAVLKKIGLTSSEAITPFPARGQNSLARAGQSYRPR